MLICLRVFESCCVRWNPFHSACSVRMLYCRWSGPCWEIGLLRALWHLPFKQPYNQIHSIPIFLLPQMAAAWSISHRPTWLLGIFQQGSSSAPSEAPAEVCVYHTQTVTAPHGPGFGDLPASHNSFSESQSPEMGGCGKRENHCSYLWWPSGSPDSSFEVYWITHKSPAQVCPAGIQGEGSVWDRSWAHPEDECEEEGWARGMCAYL